MKQNDRQLKKYFREIAQWLPCSGKVKRQIVLRIQENILNFIQANPDTTMEDIYKHFGVPQSIAAAYIDDIDSPRILKTIQIWRTLKRVIITVVVIAFLLWGGLIGWAAYEEWTSVNGYITDEVIQETP